MPDSKCAGLKMCRIKNVSDCYASAHGQCNWGLAQKAYQQPGQESMPNLKPRRQKVELKFRLQYLKKILVFLKC